MLQVLKETDKVFTLLRTVKRALMTFQLYGKQRKTGHFQCII